MDFFSWKTSINGLLMLSDASIYSIVLGLCAT
jgi:hypothetical protein